MHRLATLALVLLLAACQTAVSRNDNSPYYVVPAGTRLTLHRALTVPTDRLDVHLQNGRVLTYAEINPYQPFCALDLHRRLDIPQTVASGKFTIRKTSQEIIQTQRAPGARLASDGSPSFEIYNTVLELRSETQPQVTRLTCGQWVYPPQQRHVTVNEMRQALGSVFTLRLPDQGG